MFIVLITSLLFVVFLIAELLCDVFCSRRNGPFIPSVLGIKTFIIANLLIRGCYSLYKIWSKSTLETGIEFFFPILFQILLIISGSVEKNPGPDFGENKLSFALWNLDIIPVRDYARIPAIESFQAVYNLDIFGVCESSLTKDVPNENIFINGFSPEPYRSDKQVNAHNGGVCMY